MRTSGPGIVETAEEHRRDVPQITQCECCRALDGDGLLPATKERAKPGGALQNVCECQICGQPVPADSQLHRCGVSESVQVNRGSSTPAM